MKTSFRVGFLAFCSLLIFSPSVEGVIVGGTLGTGNNNSSEASLQSYLSTTSYGEFGYWDNLVRVNDASGVYLGYHETTGNGWVLSAAHVPSPANITVAGVSYTVFDTHPIAGTDLRLLEISGVASTPAASLPTINLASSTAATHEFVLMTGRGYTNSTTYPYPWAGTSTSDSQVMRWGTNRVNSVEITTIGSVTSTSVTTVFDPPSATTEPGAVTDYEAQAAIGDSGGGMFAYRDGEWELIGIGHFVRDVGGSPPSSAEYGDQSVYTHVFTYRDDIETITGSLIPEPSALLCLALAGTFAAQRRRRK